MNQEITTIQSTLMEATASDSAGTIDVYLRNVLSVRWVVFYQGPDGGQKLDAEIAAKAEELRGLLAQAEMNAEVQVLGVIAAYSNLLADIRIRHEQQMTDSQMQAFLGLAKDAGYKIK